MNTSGGCAPGGLLRFLVTWEAIEHDGPGVYDEEYLASVREVIDRAAAYGLDVFIDPHQDCWSRFSGGDGAPGWTFEAAGMDLTRLHETGTAFVHQLADGEYPRMIWPTNESKLAAATMASLFFGGNDFAPATRVDGEPIQDYLQRHYIAAVVRLAQALRGATNVVGYDTLNEPMFGYIGWGNLRVAEEIAKRGPAPSPYQSMLLGAGYPQRVNIWRAGRFGFLRTGRRVLNPDGVRVWLPGRECVWRENGVWDLNSAGKPRLLRPFHFARRDGKPVDFPQEYYLPFARAFTEAVRAVDPKAAIFVESGPRVGAPRWAAPNIVYAPHWYDGYALFLKEYSHWVAVDSHRKRLVFTPGRIRHSFQRQLEHFLREADKRLGGAPVLLGEFGIPMDLQNRRAFRTGDFSGVRRALDRTMRALEDALLSGTIWNYTPDNTNARGDQWNGEDLSLFSRDQQSDPADINSGGRALEAAVRPYARAIAGTPLRMRFSMTSHRFELVFRDDPGIDAPTEIFLPSVQYPGDIRVDVTDGSHVFDMDTRILTYRHARKRETHTVRVSPRKRRRT
jgi:hypothetical protein